MLKLWAPDKLKLLGLAARKFAVLVAACGMAMMASANPTGGVVTSGSATIAKPAGTTQVIQQNSQQAIIQWKSFNIAPNETTRFVQPNASATALNRISPHQGASQIFGKLQANGRIILVNQAGIYFGPGSRVDVGGIIASTADISDQNFKAGKFIFDKPSQYAGSVINRGTINAADYGLVALVGKNVVNEGVINARLGNVVLASGNKFTFDFSGDQLINFSVNEEADSAGVDHEGKQLKNGVSNSGQILADGGTVRLSGKAARGVVDNVINMSGVIQAKSVSQKNGVIILGADNGSVSVSGKMIATGHGVGQRGGKVKILAKKIVVKQTALVDVSGDSGGGEILVGGNYQGQGPEMHALNTTVEAGALLNADAVRKGNGGKVVVWSDIAAEDGSTQFYGKISARGGAQGGNGGIAETSGHYLDIAGAKFDLSAPLGKKGSLLLDPTNLTISTSPTANPSPFSNPYTGSNASTTSNVNVTDLVNALANADVTILTTSGGAGGGQGDITVANAITWTSSSTLTLNAFRNIVINAGITATNGGLTLTAANSANSITTGTGGTINVGKFNITQGHWMQNSASLPSFAARNFNLNSGNGAVATVSFVRAVGGAGTSLSPYLITDVYGLQGIGSSVSGSASPTLTNYFSLNNNIDASGTTNWVNASGAGFLSIGVVSTNSFAPYTGIFDGRGFTIDKLYMNSSATTINLGLFSTLGGSAILRNVGLTNVNMISNTPNNLGALAGSVPSGTQVQNSYSTGSVINRSNASATAGLIGVSNGGQTSNSYSSANVIGGFTVGGLIGSLWGGGTITNSYATGSVTGVPLSLTTSLHVGGLLGSNFGAGGVATITNSYSSGAVVVPTAVAGVTINVGGLVGNNYGSGLTVANSFWDTVTSGRATSSGSSGAAGYRGMTTAQMMNSANFTNSGNGFVTGGGWSLTSTPSTTLNTAPSNVWFIAPGGSGTRPILLSELFPTTTTLYQIQNAHQLQLVAASLNSSYTLLKKIDLASAMTNAADVWGTNKNTSTGTGFVAIGQSANRFTGTFNGNNYTIDNLYSRATSGDIGLFGQINGATIQNLGVTNADIVSSAAGGGILVGTSLAGTLSNVYTTGSISAPTFTAGGLIGTASTGVTAISNAYSSASVSGGLVGGLVGSLAGGSTINNTYALGSVAGTSTAGGLVGQAASATINSSYSSGAVSGAGTKGGFLGTNAGSVVVNTNNYWDTTTSGQSGSAGGSSGTGTVLGLTTAQMMSAGNFSGWSIGSTPSLDATVPGTTWFLFSGNTRPMLMSEYRTTITNAHQLQLAGTTLAANYTLANDIDMTSAMNNASDVWATTATTGKGFVPIGTSFSSVFSGSFNGQNYLINNIKINRPSEEMVGLFGIASGTNIANVGISGSITGYNYVGGLVGLGGSNLNMSNVYNKASITGTYAVGGLIGSAQNNNIISGSYNAGSVLGLEGVGGPNYIGGLAGQTLATSVITTSYNSGAVSLTGSASGAGGLVGYNDGTLNYSYNVGTVTSGTSGDTAAGAVGFNTGLVANVYSSGLVVNGGIAGKVAGLVGENQGTVTSSFWDTDTSNKNQFAGIRVNLGTVTNVLAGCFDGSCTNGGTVNLSSLATYTSNGWSSAPGVDGSISSTISLTTTPPNYTWFIFNTAAGNTRPMLMAEYTQNITNAHQLQLVGTTLAGVYTLANDVDMAAGMNNKADVWGTNASLYDPTASVPTLASLTGRGFVPIGTASNPFTGQLDGQYHTINNIFINSTLAGAGPVALFSQIGSSTGGTGTVQKIGMVGGSITNSNQSVASFAGILTGNGLLNEVFSTVNLTAYNDYPTGSAVTYWYNGGLVGVIVSSTGTQLIKDSYFAGNLNLLRGVNAATTSNIERSAGIVGANQTLNAVVNSFNLGLIRCMNGGSAATCGGTNFDSVNGAIGINGSTVSTYSNSTTSGLATAGTNATSLTTANMQIQNNFVGYDFQNIWGMTTDSYPYLRGFYPSAPRVISGSAPAANTTVAIGGIDSNGNASVQTGNSYADSSFYFLAKNSAQGTGSFANGSPIVFYLPYAGATYNNIIRAAPANNGNITGLTFSNAVANQIVLGGDGVTATLSSTQVGKIGYQFAQQFFKPDYLWYQGNSSGDITLLTNTSLVNGASTPSATTFLVDSSISNVNSSGTTFSGNTITLTGPIIFGNGTALTVKTAGAQTYNGAATLAADVIFNTTNSGVTFGSMLNGGYGLTTNSGSGTVTFGGIVGGSTALSSITINGASSPTNINTTAITTTGDQLYAGPITLTQSTSLTSSLGGNITANGIISGIGRSLTLSTGGGGMTNLFGVNTYTGGTLLNSGILNLGTNSALGTGLLTMAGGTLIANTNGLSFANAYAIGGSATASLGGSNSFSLTGAGSFTNSSSILRTTNIAGTITLSNVLSGAGSVQVNSDGTLALTNTANTYTGSTTINAGTLSVTKLANYSASSSIGSSASGTLTIGSATAGTLINANSSGTDSSNRLIALGAGGGTIQNDAGLLSLTGNITNNSAPLTFQGAGNTTVTGIIGNGSGTLTKTGSGNLTLSGNNSYSGITTLNGGTLTVGHNNAIGLGNLVLTSGTLQSNGTITLGNNYTANGAAIGGTNNLTLSGLGTLSTTLNVTNTANTITLSGNLSGAGSLVENGVGGTLAISGANNSSYSGATTLTNGTLQIGAASNALGSGALNLNGGNLQSSLTASLGNAYTVGGNIAINGSNNLTLSGTGTLNNGNTLTSTNTGTTTLSGNLSGAGNLTENAVGGTLVISGANNSSYSGATTLTNGTLQIGVATNALGSGALNLNGGNLQSALTASLGNAYTVGGNAAINGSNNLTLSGAGTLNNGITLTTTNTGTTTLSGNLSGSGNLTENAVGGTLVISGANNSSYSGATTLSNGTLQINVATNALGSGALNLNGGNLQSTLTASLGNVYTVGGSTTINGSNNLTLSGAGTLNNNLISTNTGTTTLSGNLSGAGNLTENAVGGTLAISGTDNSGYSGATTLTSGTLQIGAATNALGSGALNLNGGNLQSALTASLGNVYTVGGNAAINGSNNLTLSGAGTLNNGTTLTSANTGTTTLSGNVSGAGSLVENGVGGVLTLSGSNSYTGNTTVTNGTLNVLHTNALGNGTLNSAAIQVASGATLNFNLGGAPLANGAATITINGSGVGGNGALTFSGTGDSLNNAISLAGDTTLGGAGSGTLNGTLSGGFNLVKLGAGTIVLNHANTYTGTTTIRAGTLAAANSGAFGSNSVIVRDNGTVQLNDVAVNNALTLGTASTIGNLVGTGGTSSAWNGNITLGANSTIGTTLNSDRLTLGGTVNGGFDLTLQGPGAITIANTMGNVTPLNSLTVNNTLSDLTVNTAAITTANDQTYQSPITLGANAVLTSTSGGITLNGTLNGARTLNVVSATGITLGAAIGGSTPLTSLTLSGTGTDVINAPTITTSGNQLYDNAVNLGMNASLTSTAGGITFAQALDSVTNRSLSLTTATGTTFSNDVGTNNALGSLALSGAATDTVTGNVTTTGSQTYNGALALSNTGNMALTSTGGDITLGNGASWSGTNLISLNSNGDITINGPISGVNGSLSLSAALGSNTIHVGSNGAIAVNDFNLQQGGWTQIGASLPSFAVSDNFQLNFGQVTFIRAAGGNGSVGNPYQLFDIFGLQGVNSNATTLGNSYVLNNNIDASTTSHWINAGGTGFTPIGSSGTPFTGEFNVAGTQGYVINSLTIDRPADTNAVGMFGYIGATGHISQVGLTSINITGLNDVGGLAGNNAGLIEQSFAFGNVNGSNNGSNIGGLVGQNSGTLTNVYSLSTVTGGTGSTAIGGLVGDNSGTINTSYSAGVVTGPGGQTGGLAGANSGSIASNNYWDETTSTQSTSAGNATGLNTAAMQDQSSYVGWDFTDVWAITTGTYPYLKTFNTNPIRTISGTGLNGYSVVLISNGIQIGSAFNITTGNSFIFNIPLGSIADNSNLLLYLTGGGGAKGNIYALAPVNNGGLSGLDFSTNDILINGSAASASNSSLGAAVGALSTADILYSLLGNNLTLGNATNSIANLITTGATTYNINGTIDTTSGGTSSVLFGGAVLLNGASVTTSGTQNYAGPVTVGTNSTLTTTNSGVTFGSTITGAHDLTVAAGNGPVTFNGGVSGLTHLAVTGPTAINANITIAGAQVYNNAVTLGGSGVRSLTTTNNDISFAGTVDSLDGSQGLSINAGSGEVTFSDAVGSGSSLASLASNGNGAVAVDGGAVTTSGNQSYMGALLLGADTALTSTAGNITASSVSGSHALTLASAGSNSTISGAITNVTAFTKSGTGTLTLSGANSMASTVLNNGTLIIGNSNALGTGTLALNGGIIQTTGAMSFSNDYSVNGNATIDGGNAITLSGAGLLNSGTLNVVNTATTTLSGDISGAGALTLNAPGSMLVLSGQNTYTGATTVTAGKLRVQDANALGNGTLDSSSVSVASGAVIDFNLGGNLLANQSAAIALADGGEGDGALVFSGSGDTLNNAIHLTEDTSIGVSGSNTLGGIIDGAYSLSKLGSGTLTLLGANTYSGGTSLNAGTLNLGVSSTGTITNGPIGTGTLTLNGGTLTANSNGISIANAFVINSGSTIGGANNITLSGNGTLNAALSNTNTGVTTLSGNVGGASGLTQNSAGELVLSGTNTYSGATIVTTGTLALDSASALGNSSGTTVANNAVVDMGFSNGTLTNTQGIALSGTGIGGAGALTISGNNVTLNNAIALATDTTLGINGSNAVLGGTISGEFNLTKAGSGTLTLSGSNSHNNTTVADGTLNAASNTALGDGAVAVNNGATLGLVGTALAINNSITLNDGSTLADNNANGANTLLGTIALNGTNAINVSNATNDVLTLTGVVSGVGVTLNKGGAGTLVLVNNANSLSGDVNVNAGALNINNSNALGTADVALNNATLGLVGSLAVANNIAMNNGSTITNGNTNSTLSGTLTLDNTASSTETVNVTAGGGVVTIAGAIVGGSGTNSLILSGPGTVSMTNTNTYSGTTEVNAGTLNLTNDASLGTSSATIGNGAILNLTGTALTIANNLTLNNGSTVIDNNANGGNELSGDILLNGTTTFNVNNATNDTLTLSGALSGTGVTLTKNGAGSLVLSGANTYTGTTAVSGGTLGVASDTALGDSSASATVSTGATLAFMGTNLAVANNVTLSNGATLSDTNVSGTNTLNGTLTLSSGSGTVAVNDASNHLTLAGEVAGTGSLVKSGAGNLTLSGANSYSGSTTVSAGTLTAGAVNALSAGALSVAGIVDLNGFNQQVGTLSGAGTVTNNSGTGAVFTLNSGAPTTFSGTLAGNMGLTKMGAANLTLNGTNSYTGVTTVAAGTLTLGTGVTLNSASALNLTGGTFNLNNNTQTLAGLSGVSGTVLNLGTAGALTVNATNTTYAGSLQGVGAFTLNSGTLTLTGANTYSGTTTINNGGTLRLGASNALNSGNNVTIASGGAMNVLNTFSNTVGSINGAGNVDIGTGAALTTGNATSTNLSGVLSGAGSLTKQGTGTFVLAGANTTYSGAININNGTLSIANAQGLGVSSGVAVAAGATLNINNVSIGGGAPTVTATGLGGGNGAISGTGTASYAGDIILNGANTSINSGTGSLALGGIISGSAAFSKTGSGILALSGANTFAGNTTISAGTLRLDAAGTLDNTIALQLAAGTTFDLNNNSETIGSLNGLAGSIVSLGSGTLTTGNSTGASYAGSIEGSGGLTKQGSGNLTLSGTNTYTGNTTINAGTLSLGASNVLSDSSAVTLTTGAGLNLQGNNETIASLAGTGGTVTLGAGRLTTGDSNNTTFAGSIVGSGGLTKQGSGIFTLNNANTYTGSTLINAGTLQLGTTGSLATASAVVLADTAGATLDLNSNNKTIGSLAGGGTTGGNVTLGSGTLTVGSNNTSTTYSGLIDGTGGITKVGSGTLILGQDNNYTGTTSINAGTLQLGSADAIPASSTLNIGSSGTLNLSGFDKTFGGLSGNGNINLGTATLTINNAANDVYGGVLSGSGNFIKTGVGNLTLSQATAYTGDTTLQNGTLILGVANALANSSSLTIDSGATLDMSGLNNSLNGLNGSGNILMGAGNLTVNNTTNTLFAGNINGSGQLIKTGTGVLTLSGNSNYTGATSINAGTLSITNTTSLANSSGTSVAAGAALNIANTSVTLNPIVLAGSLTSSGTSSLTGDISLAGNGIINSSGTFDVNGAITGTSGLTLSGAGTISLSDSLIGLSSVTSNVNHLILNGGAVTTTGSQYYSNTVTLGVDNIFTVGNNSVLALPAVWNGNLSVTGGSGSALYAPGKTTGHNTFNLTTELGGSINDPIYFNNFYTINGLGNSSVVFTALARNLVQNPSTGVVTAWVGNKFYTFVNIPLSAFSGNIEVPPSPTPTPNITYPDLAQLMAQMTSSSGGFTPVQNQENQTDNMDAMEDIYDIYSNPVVTANIKYIEQLQNQTNAQENRRTYKICPALN